MHKRILIAVLCMLFPVAAMAQTGKISGKILDRETGEPLIGANVIVEGTERGAASNINGEFVILNVQIGKVTLVASYIGYQNITVRDLLIRSNETANIDFELPSESFRIDQVEIIAEKPLVDNNTNFKSTITQDDIQNLPVRGVEGYVAVAAGAVMQNGDLYVRGSRGDATGFIVDGVWVNDPMYGGRSLTIIDNAIAEVSFQAGGYSAEYGGANGGLVTTTTRSGTRQHNINLDMYTDAWGKTGEENFLGGYNYGFSRYILTVGGPVTDKIKYFVAGQNTFARTPARYLQPMQLADQYDAKLRSTAAHALLSPEEQKKVGIFDPRLGSAAKKIDYTMPGGFVPNNATEAWALNGNMTLDLNPVNIRVGGTYGRTSANDGDATLGMANPQPVYGPMQRSYQVGRTATQNSDGSWSYSDPTGLANEARSLWNQTENWSANLKLTHLLSQNTFYEVFLNYFGNFNLTMDPDHQHDIFAYGDSAANYNLYGYESRGDGLGPRPVELYGHRYEVPGSPSQGYAYNKSRYTSISGKLNFVHQIGSTHELRLGGEASMYEMRQYYVTAYTLKSFLRNNPDANPIQQSINARTGYFGYDQWGAKVDDGDYGPRKPLFASAYVLDKIELEDLVLNLGLRFDYIDTDSWQFVNENDIKFDENNMIDLTSDNIKEMKATAEISPRIGFSFPVTDQTVFYAQYGKFVQQSRLRDVYLGYALMSSNIKGGYAIQNPVGYGLRPELLTQYDFGFRQQIGDHMAFDIAAFYKDIKDQIQQQQITAAPGAEHLAYYSWVNGDFATTSGISLKMTLRRVERVQASLDYTYSDARGTGSASSSSFRTLWQAPTETPYLPKYITPLDFDQTHRGAVNLDYRFGPNDGGPILERMGLNILFAFNSGHPYTRTDEFSYANRRQPIETMNESLTPWIYQMDLRLDKTITVGPLDINMYIWVINLINTQNVEDVFRQSGSASDDGYLSTDAGKQQLQTIAGYGGVYEDLYRDYYYQMEVMNQNFYSRPMQVRLGLRIDF